MHVNEVQGNPFQPDVNYRGYTASPLLGTPQGLSVYMDGVRLNQPFGEVVSWDLIPAHRHRVDDADAGIEPAVRPEHARRRAVDPDQGRASTPGTTVQAIYGSDAAPGVRVRARRPEGDAGCNWYLAGNLFAEDGWRDDSPSDVRQLFGKLGWQRATDDVALTLAHADNSLTGNGLQEQRLSRRATTPASTRSRTSPTIARRSSTSRRAHSSSAGLTFSGNAYYRDIRTNTLNGDINEDSLDQAMYQPSAAERAALAAAGYTGFPASGANADEHAVSRPGAASATSC